MIRVRTAFNLWVIKVEDIMSASRRLLIRALLFAALLLIVPACAPPPQQAALPTLLVLPSLTPTLTHTATLTATFTPPATATATLTPTVTPSSTATATATVTPTPTSTPTVTNTLLPSPTFTSTVTTPDAATATPDATANLATPAPAETVEGLAILTFTGSTTTAAPGASLILSWSAQGDTARLETLTAQGVVISELSVPLQAAQTVTVPSVQGNTVIYRLRVAKGTQERSQILTISLTLACPIPWFFPNPSAAIGCPAAPSQTVPGAYQVFQEGAMLLTNIGAQETIYALANQGASQGFVSQPTYAQRVTGWDGVTDHCAETPPANLFKPTGHFNWMACTQFGPAGLWRNTIGWATGPVDLSNRTFQLGSDGSLVFDLPGGRLLRLLTLQPGEAYGRWQPLN